MRESLAYTLNEDKHTHPVASKRGRSIKRSLQLLVSTQTLDFTAEVSSDFVKKKYRRALSGGRTRTNPTTLTLLELLLLPYASPRR